MAMPRLILASASPRRRELLGREGFIFTVEAASIDESIGADEAPLLATCRLAAEKAIAVTGRCGPGDVVLAADTSVICDGRLYGKPVDSKDACRQLTNLAGRNHHVVTAWTIVPLRDGGSDGGISGYTRSVVRMRELGRAEIFDYVESGESLDKAGSYAVQGQGRKLIGAVLGCLDNVIGLPMAQVAAHLEAVGVERGTGR
jgi:septum formation protein